MVVGDLGGRAAQGTGGTLVGSISSKAAGHRPLSRRATATLRKLSMMRREFSGVPSISIWNWAA